MIEIFTIGFTQKPAERFFGLLKENNVDLLIDIRRRPEGQLSGFAKKADLPYFMNSLVGGQYLHMPELAPEDDILSAYRKNKDWAEFEKRFNEQMDLGNIPEHLDRSLFESHRGCFLCSEHRPEQCHRRFVAERIARSWDSVTIHHLY
jgi:uncharacterized protein (DUF488 family)